MDKKAPTITITSPAGNVSYQLNGVIAASYACSDGGAGVASCQGSVPNGSPIDTSTTGTKTFSVEAKDKAGWVATQAKPYSVASGGGGGQTSADLSITFLSAPSKVSPGATLTYWMTVTNLGKATASGVRVASPLGPTTFVSVSASQWGTPPFSAPPVGGSGTVDVNLGSLANGAKATVGIVVRVTMLQPGVTFPVTGSVYATTQDLNSKNNSVTQKITVKQN